MEEAMADDVFESPEEHISYNPEPERQPWEEGRQKKKVPAFSIGLRSISKDFESDFDDDESEMVDPPASSLTAETVQNMAPSPTGYRDYKPPTDIIQLHNTKVSNGQPWSELKEQPVHKVCIAISRVKSSPKFHTHTDYLSSFQTILLGDSGVGKTSLLVQFDTGKFQTGNFSATVGIGFTNKVVNVDDKSVKLQIWDTAGQERFRSVTHAYYRDAHALLLLYDVSNKTSFDNIRAWLGEIREYANDEVVIMLIGNKADCSSDDRVVSEDCGKRVAREYGVTFVETSAKTGLNVEAAFLSVAR
ncbi:hypothetical protein J437_LFUL005934 [Ladona fulva]|uniref:Uncharacterized protein n=1 Tax=Ladona fulva TaxID=123851 RepID=A0A8K0K3V1_LADFU|nr:hypothetical protein J437_LFUL005934 [Ladona fulva]